MVKGYFSIDENCCTKVWKQQENKVFILVTNIPQTKKPYPFLQP